MYTARLVMVITCACTLVWCGRQIRVRGDCDGASMDGRKANQDGICQWPTEFGAELVCTLK